MLTRLFALLLAATLGAAADEESCWTKHQGELVEGLS